MGTIGSISESKEMQRLQECINIFRSEAAYDINAATMQAFLLIATKPGQIITEYAKAITPDKEDTTTGNRYVNLLVDHGPRLNKKGLKLVRLEPSLEHGSMKLCYLTRSGERLAKLLIDAYKGE